MRIAFVFCRRFLATAGKASPPDPPRVYPRQVRETMLPARLIAIRAPNLGTFYRAPKPGAPPYVEVGQTIEESTEVCLIEVMKLFAPVAAGVRGVVRDLGALGRSKGGIIVTLLCFLPFGTGAGQGVLTQAAVAGRWGAGATRDHFANERHQVADGGRAPHDARELHAVVHRRLERRVAVAVAPRRRAIGRARHEDELPARRARRRR